MSESQRQAIIDGLKAGTPYRTIAAEARCGTATVGRVAKAEGIERHVPRVKKAAEANRDYAQGARLDLLNRFFDKAEALLKKCAKPHDLQSLATALAILVDKRRLEDGEATSRSEVRDTTDARNRIAGKLDELAARRTAAGAA